MMGKRLHYEHTMKKIEPHPDITPSIAGDTCDDLHEMADTIAEPEKKLLRILKVCMISGLLLLIVGHVVLSVTFIYEHIGYHGYVLGAALSAIGIVLSLPTKLYLTVLLMEHENDTRTQKSKNC